jgi:transposase
MKKFEIQPGNEIRGMMIRLYPDKETEEKLIALQRDTKYAWNFLVKMVGYDPNNDVSRAREAHALREGLVEAKPTAPEYKGMTPEQSKEAKKAYIQSLIDWSKKVIEATKDIPGCQPYKFKELLEHFKCDHDYQMLGHIIDSLYEEEDAPPRLIRPGAFVLQALTKNFFTKAQGMKCKKFRKFVSDMPLQVRSGDCFKLGNFGSRGHTHKNKQTDACYYNCQVQINGLKIKGRLPGKQPEGRWLEGVSLTKKADGWWASIKVEVPKRIIPEAIPGSVIGIDVGLDNIAAMSDGTIVSNKRGKEYAERIAGRQTMAAERRANNLPADRMENATHRLQLAVSRHMKHEIYNKIIKPLAMVETIKIEELNAKIGQMGSAKMSVMRLIRSLLIERYGARDDKNQSVLGNRVREVEPHFTSQDCSQCGHRSKESWSYDHGRIGECPMCKFRADRDFNASRNIASKPAISLTP